MRMFRGSEREVGCGTTHDPLQKSEGKFGSQDLKQSDGPNGTLSTKDEMVPSKDTSGSNKLGEKSPEILARKWMISPVVPPASPEYVK